MTDLNTLIAMAKELNASDVHIVSGLPVRCRVDGSIRNLTEELLTFEDCENYGRAMAGPRFSEIEEMGELDLAQSFPCGARTRINLFRQQGSLSAAIRLLAERIPELEELNLPPVVASFPDYRSGIVLVTGETGSGKSTTLAAILNRINHTRCAHIITLEDPIEYVYHPDKCIINQRQIGSDTHSYADGLRSILREDPDVILVGEMRDYETISAALLAAETGHLVLSTLHTTGAAQTVERIIDACPAEGQNQVRIQLAGTLKGIISQCLIPCGGGLSRVAATEVLTGNDAILNLIREGKTHQMPAMMQSGAAKGMHTLNMDLLRLMQEGYITQKEAVMYTNDKAELLSTYGI